MKDILARRERVNAASHPDLPFYDTFGFPLSCQAILTRCALSQHLSVSRWREQHVQKLTSSRHFGITDGSISRPRIIFPCSSLTCSFDCYRTMHSVASLAFSRPPSMLLVDRRCHVTQEADGEWHDLRAETSADRVHSAGNGIE